MSFPTLWRKWMSECVCTATTSVLVNGSPTEEFPLERGSDKSWANVRALRAVLVLFEKVSGLKVNFHKSLLVGVNIGESWLTEAAYVLGCMVGKVPFMYLDLPIWGDPHRLSFWEPMLTRIRTSEGHRKVSWISWQNVCLGKEHGGLGLLDRYGEVVGRLAVGGRGGSAWWREVSRIRDGEGAVGGGWFVESIERRVGNGANTFFLTDLWLGGVPLSVRYRRLFDLATDKSISVADMCGLGWEEGGAA
ncbi:cysteine-rich receptor-like protein kinase [Trifolium pratense]|uniref:Cysteine-rich receptor-like protein kinase n=1 Tax=Trifolium pratense TaxID=57577 RepID=A0A2K3P1Z6_TRIPR|nr:cysteine-rich receptor-like protein kinase [Trifolium pratense]